MLTPSITYDQAATMIREINSMAFYAKNTHNQLFDKYQQIMKEANSRTKSGRRRYSARFARFVAGMIHIELQDNLQSVEFVYRDQDGVIYSTMKGSSHRSIEEFYATGRGVELGKMERAHVWIGTDKPYTAWSK